MICKTLCSVACDCCSITAGAKKIKTFASGAAGISELPIRISNPLFERFLRESNLLRYLVVDYTSKIRKTPAHFTTSTSKSLGRRIETSSLPEEKMRRNTLTYCCAVLTLLLAPVCLVAQGETNSSDCTQAAEKTQIDPRVTGGIVTLYALDPLAGTFCFADGKDGHVVQNNEVRNRCSDIDFNNYNAGTLSIGVEGGRVGRIIDLGNATDLKQRYGYEETVGNGQGFASLRVEDGRVVILKDRRSQTIQELRESAPLFQEGASGASAPIRLGNIYLVRISDRHDRTFQRIVKLVVIAYTRNESVTIRWQVL